MSADHPILPRRPLVQLIGAVLWPSFFSAAIAAAVFFAFVDPLAVYALAFPGHAASRAAVYAQGFFLLWLACAAACAITALLVRPVDRDGPEAWE